MERWIEHYLSVLNLSQQPPTTKYLKQIVRAHVRCFPFENIGKLIQSNTKKSAIDIGSPHQFLEHFERFQTGGTCFALNANLCRLLTALGFDAFLIRPGEEHMAIVVKDPIDEHMDFYVDVGTTAPLFAPVPFHGRRHALSPFAGERLLFYPERHPGVYTYVRVRGNQITERKWTFSIHESMSEFEFQPWIERSFHPHSPFMSMIRCQLWLPDERKGLSLVNNRFTIRSDRGTLTRTLHDIDALEKVMNEEFQMPKIPITQAIDILNRRGIQIFTH